MILKPSDYTQKRRKEAAMRLARPGTPWVTSCGRGKPENAEKPMIRDKAGHPGQFAVTGADKLGVAPFYRIY